MKNHRLIGPNDVCTTKASTRSLSRINHFRKQKIIIICIRFFWWNSFFLKPQSVFLLLFHFIITELFWGKNRWYISLFHYQARKARSSDLRLLRNKLLSEPVKVVHDFGFTFLRTLSSVSHFLFLSVSPLCRRLPLFWKQLSFLLSSSLHIYFKTSEQNFTVRTDQLASVNQVICLSY